MPKTLSNKDPNLLAAVRRLQRVQQVWGVLLIALGALTEVLAGREHPVSGLPFIAIGIFAWRWAEPALLATVATLMALSIVPTINPRLPLFGPDPVTLLAQLSVVEMIALVAGKMLITVTAANQFFLYRFLYGTAQATSDDPDFAIIPPMVPNRTDGLARSGRWLGIISFTLAAVALLFLQVDPTAYMPRIFAEMGGSLAGTALGLGLGASFSPTNERPAALLGISLGSVAYLMAAFTLLQLPG